VFDIIYHIPIYIVFRVPFDLSSAIFLTFLPTEITVLQIHDENHSLLIDSDQQPTGNRY